MSRLGAGGAGVVWRAEDTLLRRAVAIKEVHSSGDGDRDDMLREARAAARLDHPGAVTVYDVVQDGGGDYIVMQLVEGPNLAEEVAERGPLDDATTATLGLRLLDVVEAAHEQGLIHRDIKPANVMFPGDGRAQLTDFGIARLMDDPRDTTTGMVRGTPQYMSPEQAADGRIGPATDLWSLGATLYFASEGTAPFDKGQALATLNAVVAEPPRRPQRAGPLAEILLSLLAKEPEERAGVAEVRRHLRAVADSGAPTRELLEPWAASSPVRPATKARRPSPAVSDGADTASRLPPPASAPERGNSWPDAAPSPPAAPPQQAEPAPPASPATPAEYEAESVTPAEGEPAPAPPAESEAALVPPAESVVTPVPPAVSEAAPVSPVVSQADSDPWPEPTAPDSAVPPPPASRATPPEHKRRRPAAAIIAAVAVLGLLAVVFAVVEGGDRSGSRSGAGTAAKSRIPASGSPASGSPATGSLATGTTPTTAAPRPAASAPTSAPGGASGAASATVPANWVTYTDPQTGFQLRYPPGWKVSAHGTHTTFTDPPTGDYLLIDHQTPPAATPQGPWYTNEPGFAASHADYQRIGITTTQFHGYPAALWEYEYNSGAQRLHAIDLGMIVGSHGYAFNFQSSAGRWAGDQHEIAELKAGFTPAG